MRFDFNAETWPLKPQSFDVVVAAEVLEHLYHPERVLMRIQNMLRPGGMLIGSVPNAFTLKCRLKYLVASKRGTPLADAMHINQFGWNEFGQLMGRHFADVSLFPLGKPRGGLRDAIPSLFSYGIAFKALQLR
jgi:SAM-dependent methyltransferase